MTRVQLRKFGIKIFKNVYLSLKNLDVARNLFKYVKNLEFITLLKVSNNFSLFVASDNNN